MLINFFTYVPEEVLESIADMKKTDYGRYLEQRVKEWGK